MIFNFLFLPVLFFIGVITTYEDIKYGKVRNKWILLGLFWGLLVIVSFFVWYPVSSPITHFFYFDVLERLGGSPVSVFTVSPVYLLRVLLNATIALIVAFLMWRGGAWAAGDAKLFFVYSLLLPLGYYWKSYLPLFPSFALLVNIFVPIFIYLLIKSFFFSLKHFYSHLKLELSKKDKTKEKRKKKKEKGETWGTIKGKLIMIVVFVDILLVFKLFQEPIKNYTSIDIGSFQAFLFAAIIIFRSSLMKIFKKKITPWIAVFFFFFSLFYGLTVSISETWKILYQSVLMMAVFMALYGLVRKMIGFHILKTGVKKVKVSDLKEKMNLGERIVEEIKKDKEFYQEHIGRFYPEGLTQEQVQPIKRWLLRKKKEEVIVNQPFPFVLWMFFGIIITIILKKSLFHLFINVV